MASMSSVTTALAFESFPSAESSPSPPRSLGWQDNSVEHAIHSYPNDERHDQPCVGDFPDFVRQSDNAIAEDARQCHRPRQ